MNKSVYLALIGATAAQKTPFAKRREADLHKRKLQPSLTSSMEGMGWDDAASEEGEPIEWEGEGEWGESTMLPPFLDFYPVKEGEDIKDYDTTFPKYSLFLDLMDMEEHDGGVALITGYFGVVHDYNGDKTEACKT